MSVGFAESATGRTGSVRAVASAGNHTQELRFSSSDASLRMSGNALFAATLVPSMRYGGRLVIHQPISRHLLEATGAIADVLTTWYPQRFQRVTVDAPASAAASPALPDRAAAFFTGGVDSLYTLLKHRDAIGTLIYVHGFDLALERTALRGMVTQKLRETAAGFGKQLIEVETNLRDFHDRHAHWGTEAHGAALATVAHLLEEHFSRIYVPASSYLTRLIPWGSHPLLDPLWSSDRLRFFHDGCEASRFEKVERVARAPEALRALRVCWKNTGDSYNCCRCEKCVRTMIQLDALNALDRCPAFPVPLSPGLIEGMELSSFSARIYHYQTLEELVRRNLRPDLQRAIRDRLSPYRDAEFADVSAVMQGRPSGQGDGWLSRVRRWFGRQRSSRRLR
jgi:hypothetical protein